MNVKCFHCGIAHNCNFCPNCGAPALPPSQTHLPRKKGISAGAIVLIVICSCISFLVLAALASNNDSSTVISDSVSDTEVIAKADVEPEELLFKPGDVIVSNKMEVTINRVDFSYDVVPDDTSSFYTHYEADGGEVYIHIDTDVKNLSKKDLDCDEILTVKADYDDGFTYRGFAIVEDSMTGFTYASITTVDPLKTQGVHFLISCPEEVIESDKPLFIELKLDGTSEVYRHTIR